MKRHLIGIAIGIVTVCETVGSAHAHTYSLPSGLKAFGHCAKGPCMKRTDWSFGRDVQYRQRGAPTISIARKKRNRNEHYAARD
jgi:hypothetical protein